MEITFKPSQRLRKHEKMVYDLLRETFALTAAQVRDYIILINDTDKGDLIETIPISLTNKRFLFYSGDRKFLSPNPRIRLSKDYIVDLDLIISFWVFLEFYETIEGHNYTFARNADIPIQFASKNKLFKIVPHKIGSESIIQNMSKYEQEHTVFIIVATTPELALHYLELNEKGGKGTIYVALMEGSALGERSPDISLYAKKDSLLRTFPELKD